MMLSSLNRKLFSLVAVFLAATSCTSTDSQDDQSMEMEEPVEASAAGAEGDEPQVAAPEEAKPTVQSDSAVSSAVDPMSAPASVPASSVAPVTTPAANMVSSPRNDARVMYVKSDGVAMRESPDPKSKIVGKLKRGDHRLVTVDGDWARTEDGKFIALTGLTQRGVSRLKKDVKWSVGAKGPKAAAKKVNGDSSSKSADGTQRLPDHTKSSAKPSSGGVQRPGAEGATSDPGQAPAAK
jgi:hypothetical protein